MYLLFHFFIVGTLRIILHIFFASSTHVCSDNSGSYHPVNMLFFARLRLQCLLKLKLTYWNHKQLPDSPLNYKRVPNTIMQKCSTSQFTRNNSNILEILFCIDIRHRCGQFFAISCWLCGDIGKKAKIIKKKLTSLAQGTPLARGSLFKISCTWRT